MSQMPILMALKQFNAPEDWCTWDYQKLHGLFP